MKISKRIIEEKKTYRGLETHLRLESPIPIQQWPRRCMLVMVGDGCCVFGRTWWWEGGRTREARDNEERKFEHALNKSRGYVEFPFVVDSCFPRSFSLPPPSSSKRTTTITTIAYKLGAAALRRLLDGNRGLETHLCLESPVCFFFFFFYSFTNFHYRYTTFTRTITTINSNSISASNSTTSSWQRQHRHSNRSSSNHRRSSSSSKLPATGAATTTGGGAAAATAATTTGAAITGGLETQMRLESFGAFFLFFLYSYY